MDAGVVYDTDFVTATNADISMLSDIDGLNWTLLAITSCPHSVIYNLTKTIWVWCDTLVLSEYINKSTKH